MENLATLDANALAETLLGNSIYANVMMLGCAWQQGLVPVSLEAIMRAIELNGVEVEKNRRAFSWGRIAAAKPETVFEIAGDSPAGMVPAETLDELIQRCADFLVDSPAAVVSVPIDDIGDHIGINDAGVVAFVGSDAELESQAYKFDRGQILAHPGLLERPLHQREADGRGGLARQQQRVALQVPERGVREDLDEGSGGGSGGQ